MAHILVVDDEEKIRALVKKYAALENHIVTEAADGLEAVEACRKNTFALVVMDVMLPGLDGFSAVREIRKNTSVPVIMLSARGEEYDRIHGFESGVDDYVVKPFSPKELMMRIDAVLKRTAGASAVPVHEEYLSGPLSIDFTARVVRVNNAIAELSPKECELLFYLVCNRGIALSREQLITAVWGYDFFGDDRTLDTHIKTLRKALGDASTQIVTLRGIGYRFDGQEEA